VAGMRISKIQRPCIIPSELSRPFLAHDFWHIRLATLSKIFDFQSEIKPFLVVLCVILQQTQESIEKTQLLLQIVDNPIFI
jgi:hypothetical protein